MMNLITMPIAVGSHLAGWRHPQAWRNTTMNLAQIIEVARTAERGKLDCIFLADGNGVRNMDKPSVFASANSPGSRPATFEPLTLLGALSQHTSSIGLVATATTTYEEPYAVARKFASLDHLSGGRAGWNVVTTTNAGDSLNFGRDEHMAKSDRYDRAEEFIQVVRGLWDSCEPDAFVENTDTGVYLDPDKFHVLGHQGAYFSVKGPLNVVRPPQGSPVIFMAGQSDRGAELAAKEADAVFGAGSTMEACQATYADIKGRMARYGRDPQSLRFLPGISVFVGRDADEAEALFQELQGLIPDSLAVDYLSQRIEYDLSGLPVDGPMPSLPREVESRNSFRTSIIDMVEKENLTIRQTFQRLLPSLGSAVIKGSAVEVADQMEAWYRAKACDGFMIYCPIQPRSLLDFVDGVVPELQRRGLFRSEYSGSTLRDVMGFRAPENRFRM